METALLIARLILAGVFGVAGVAKLFDLNGSQKAVKDFGVPEEAAKIFGVVLPLVEIATAVLLLPLATAWLGALSALALLLIFIGGITYNFAKGNTPDCHCFGQIHSEPVGWSTLIRNSILAAVAVFLVVFGRENPGASAFAWLADLTAAERMNLVFGVLTVGLLVFIVTKLKAIQTQQIVLQRHIELIEIGENAGTVEREEAVPPAEGLPIGAFLPAFSLANANGGEFSSADLLKTRKPALLFFVSPTCSPCAALLPEIENWRREFGAKMNFVLISAGAARDNIAKFGEDYTIVLQKDRELMDIFRAKWTPSAVLVNSDGTIGSRLATGDQAIRALVELIKPNLSNGHVPHSFFVQRENSKIGADAPEFALPDLDGKIVKSEHLRGKKTLLVFWGTGCGFCQTMLPELQNWERDRKRPAELILISRGDVEENRRQDLSSPILLQKEFEVNNLFGVAGTPSGLIIDENGKIASELAVGADEVFALVGKYRNS